MFTLFANLFMLLTWGPYRFTKGTPYIFYFYMIKCGRLLLLGQTNSQLTKCDN